MCGIFGGVGVTSEEASLCIKAIRRGNDGISVNQFGDVIMAARRHLVKESVKTNVQEGKSDQPYISKDGRVQLVFNGELYNFAEIREDLFNNGMSFETEGDTEVFLKLYEYEGKNFVKNKK